MLTAAILAVGSISGCANREYLSSGILREVQKSDPRLEMVRVYPSAKYVVQYEREIGDDLSISSTQGAVETDYRGQRAVYVISRKLPGAIVEVETHEGMPLLWVTFNQKCNNKTCAYGFVQTDDALYRLVHVPRLAGFAEPEVYRKRVRPRKKMRKTKIYSKSKSLPVYFTTRGITASIALEVKKSRRVEIETVVVPETGVPATAPVRPAGPGPEPVEPAEPADASADGRGSVGVGTRPPG